MNNVSTAEPATPRRGGIAWRDLNWNVISAIGALHVIAIAAALPWFFSWSGLILFAVLGWLTIAIGIGLCYHRLLTHRSFRTPKWFEYLLTLIASLNWQGGAITWVGTHRLHHKHADDDLDPHSPKHGFTWAHILWTLHNKLEGIEGREAAKDLQRDKFHRVMDRFFWLPQVVLAAALLAGGWWCRDLWLGVSWVVWGVALRTVVVFHFTWFVNSASHTWGYQNYKQTGEHSTNLWWVALLSFGEGWHNNHHAHPRSAAHGLRWFEFDMTYWTIRALGLVGLARDIQKVAPEKMPAALPAPPTARALPAPPSEPSSPQTLRRGRGLGAT